MTSLTDKGMQAKSTIKDQWLTQPFKRGSGVFVGRITPSGERLFYFRYTDSTGKRPFLPLGPYHQKGKLGLTLADAYAKACSLADLYRSGVKDLHHHFKQKIIDDSKAEEQARQDTLELQALESLERQRRISIEQLFSKWQSVELKSHQRADGKRVGRKDNGQYTLEQFKRHVFPTIGAVPACQITKGDILAILDRLKSQGKSRTCNVLLSDLKQMFKFALAREIMLTNPIAALTKRDAGGPENERERHLTSAEILALSNTLPTSNLSLRSQCAIWLLLSTACRVSELLEAKWSDIDFLKRKFHLETTKNQRSHDIHLSDFAVEQLDKLMSIQQTDGVGQPVKWIFPNTQLTGSVCSKSLNKQIADRQLGNEHPMKNRTQLTNSLRLEGGRWRPHDLRRTAATCMAKLGFTADVIDECLNHKIQSKTTRIYIRDRREQDQAKAFDALGSHLKSIVCGEMPQSNVKNFQKLKA